MFYTGVYGLQQVVSHALCSCAGLQPVFIHGFARTSNKCRQVPQSAHRLQVYTLLLIIADAFASLKS